MLFSSYNSSITLLWAIWGISMAVTYLLTYKRRRNYFSVFANTVLPFGIYSLMVYENSHLYLCAAIEMAIIVLGGIYSFAVLIRKINPANPAGTAVIMKNRILSCINGTKGIAAVCFSVLFIYVTALNAFGMPSFIPAVKPTEEVNENKEAVIEEYMPVISSIDESVWKNLSFDDRLDVLQTIANVEKTQLGISHEVNVCAASLGWGTYGTYDYSKHEVTINMQIIMDDDSTEAVKTLCHELRHAFQHDAADAYLSLDEKYQQLAVFDDMRAFYENLDDYQNASRDGFDAYENQTVEVDSRKYEEERAEFYFEQAKIYLADAA